MKLGKMDLSKALKGFNMRQLESDEVGMGFDGKTYFRRSNGDYVRYDFESQQIINTHEMKFDFGMAMIIPSPTIEVGDMIINGDDFVCITKLTKNRITGIGLNSGRSKSIVKEKSALGFNFYSKVVNMMDGGMGDSNNMFGGMNPMMLAMMGNGDDDSSGVSSMMEMMMMSQMFNGGQQSQNSFMNMFQNTNSTQNVTDLPEDEDLSEEEIDAEIDRLNSLKKNK